jgi:hypothetical protein
MKPYFRSAFIFFVFILLFQSIVVGVADLRRPYWGDEEHFVQTIRQFGAGIDLNTLHHYNEMSTPLPFIIYAFWGRLFGFEIPTLRFLSVIIALLTYLLFHRLLYLLLQNSSAAFFTGVFLAVHPYMVGFSIFVFTDMLPILFLILGCIAFLKRSAVGFGLAAAAAVMSRQYYIFFPLAAVLFSLISFSVRNKKQSYHSRDEIRMLAAAVLSLAPLGVLFLFWGGLSPDNEMKTKYLAEGLHFQPANLVLYICLLFVFLLPVVLARWRRFYTDVRLMIGAVVVSWLYWIFPVKPSKYAVAIDVHTVGLFHRLLRWLWPDSFFDQAVFYAAFLLGLPVLFFFIRDIYQRWRQRSFDFSFFLVLSILVFLGVMPFSYIGWEKYFMPIVPLASVRIMQMKPDVKRSPFGEAQGGEAENSHGVNRLGSDI